MSPTQRNETATGTNKHQRMEQDMDPEDQREAASGGSAAPPQILIPSLLKLSPPRIPELKAAL